MGGRGSSSATRLRGKTGANAAMSAKDWDELKAVAAANGIELKDSMRNIDFDCAKVAVAGVVDISNAFPEADKRLFRMGAEERRRGTFASASLSHGINVNPDYYGSLDFLEERYAAGVASGFHPKGTARAITSHEAGHILEAALVMKKHGSVTYSAVSDWNKCKIATEIIGQASRNLKKTPEGKGTRIANQIRGVSRYATKNRSEALAECVADYVSNGSNASPLSKEAWSILKQRLG